MRFRNNNLFTRDDLPLVILGILFGIAVALMIN